MTVDETTRTHGNSRDHERRHRRSGLRVTSFKPIARMKAESPTAMSTTLSPSHDGQLLTRHNIDDRATRNEKENECRHRGNGEQHPQPPIE
ncbi:MAG: hypothetical protein ACLTDR_02715 [Adlercreutzia equolifaciens]